MYIKLVNSLTIYKVDCKILTNIAIIIYITLVN